MSESDRQDLEKQLASARGELEIWEQSRFTRNDGSPAQDLRFETRGDNLREQVERLQRQIKSLQVE